MSSEERIPTQPAGMVVSQSPDRTTPGPHQVAGGLVPGVLLSTKVTVDYDE